MDCVKQAAIPDQLTHQIQDLTHAAQGHGDRLAALGQDLREFVKSLSQEQIEARNNVAVVNEASQQQQISKSTDTLMRMDEIRMNLAEMLDSTIDMLDKRKHLEDERIQIVEKDLEEQRVALREVQHSVEASVAKLTDTMAFVRMVRDEAENTRQSNINTGWRGQFYGQLIASGITSTMTAAFVFVATRLGHEVPQAVTSRYSQYWKFASHC